MSWRPCLPAEQEDQPAGWQLVWIAPEEKTKLGKVANKPFKNSTERPRQPKPGLAEDMESKHWVSRSMKFARPFGACCEFQRARQSGEQPRLPVESPWMRRKNSEVQKMNRTGIVDVGGRDFARKKR